jgi:hypothetical protein
MDSLLRPYLMGCASSLIPLIPLTAAVLLLSREKFSSLQPFVGWVEEAANTGTTRVRGPDNATCNSRNLK